MHMHTPNVGTHSGKSIANTVSLSVGLILHICSFYIALINSVMQRLGHTLCRATVLTMLLTTRNLIKTLASTTIWQVPC